jgi:hypothetical protein
LRAVALLKNEVEIGKFNRKIFQKLAYSFI